MSSKTIPGLIEPLKLKKVNIPITIKTDLTPDFITKKIAVSEPGDTSTVALLKWVLVLFPATDPRSGGALPPHFCRQNRVALLLLFRDLVLPRSEIVARVKDVHTLGSDKTKSKRLFQTNANAPILVARV